MKLGYFILLFSIIACAPEKGEKRLSKYNYTTENLKSDKGEPKVKKINDLNADYEMYHYKNEVYQVSGNKVIARFRDPKDHEKDIQYWRHHLKGEYYSLQKDTKSKSHNPMNILTCKSKGLTIYFNSKGQVKRVGESMGGKGDA